MRRLWWVLASGGLILLLVNGAAVVVLTETALHPPRTRHAGDVAILAHDVEQSSGATARRVGLRAPDGTRLSAWWIVPKGGADKAAIVCHGVGDSAMGSLGFAWLFLRHGYAVLTPESRGHGESGGFVTYGVLEAGDLRDWVEWTKAQRMGAVYGLGESLGGAIVLASLAQGADFRAVAAESAYASFVEVADDRVGVKLLVREALLYARARYGVDLAAARPGRAAAGSKVPILLIHGAEDHETPVRHSREIAAGRAGIELWIVPGAQHTGAYAAAPEEFERRVVGWFGG